MLFLDGAPARAALLLGLVLLVSACGGGGSAGGGAGGGTDNGTVPYSIRGTASGVAGPGLVLQLNGGDDLAIDVARGFAFAATVAAGAAYQVTVKSNPVGQLCSIDNATGVARANVGNVLVNCTTPTPPAADVVRLGGTLSNLQGSGLVLRNAGQDLAAAVGSSTFVFPGSLTTGSNYDVAVVAQPTSPAQTCSVANGQGVAGTADITNVSVSCITPPTAPAGGLSLDQAELSFEGEEGQSVAPKVLTGSITNATDPVIVTIAYTNRGLLAARFAFTGAVSGQVSVTPRETIDLAPGTYRDTVTVNACYDDLCARPVAGSPKSVPVTYTVRPPTPPPVLRLSDHGVAFAVTPGGSQLSRALIVRDTGSTAAGWKAVANAGWLSVTGSGASGGTLQLTARPAGLAAGLHEATVTVTADNPAISRTETVRVGLYLSSVAAADSYAAPLVNPIAGIADIANAVDPFRPLHYASAASTIAANHVHTGARAATLNVPGAEFGALVTSDDGSRLYALNHSDNTVVVVNLDTLAVAGRYGLPQLLLQGDALKSARLYFARIHGQPALLLTNVNVPVGAVSRNMVAVFKADSGELVGELFGASSREFTRLAVSRDGSVAYAAEAGLSGILSTTRVELRANSVGNLYGKAVASTQGVNEAGLQDLATNADGSQVLVAYFTDSFVRKAVFDGSGLQWTAGLPDFTWPANVSPVGSGPVDVEFDPYGKLFIHFHFYNLRVYGASGPLGQEWFDLADTALVDGPSAAMRLSSDGLRLIGGGRLMSIQP
ncbi:MAG: hypothetical protein RLZZ584_1033 [Pseudomonadota bacterium]